MKISSFERSSGRSGCFEARGKEQEETEGGGHRGVRHKRQIHDDRGEGNNWKIFVLSLFLELSIQFNSILFNFRAINSLTWTL